MRFLFALLLLTGCGYRMGDQALIDRYRTISVPFVEGDSDGRFTDALVREVGASSPLRYVSSGGQLCLKVSVVSCKAENIGYEYDDNRSGRITDRVVPTEGRLVYCVRFSLVDTRRGCVLVGPQTVSEEIAYDFDPLQTDNQLAVFSVGQFVIFDQAQDNAKVPLYERLSRKIVAYVDAAW